MGEMSAAMMQIAVGLEVPEDEGPFMADLRRALTTSFTPRRRVLVLAAGSIALAKFRVDMDCEAGAHFKISIAKE